MEKFAQSVSNCITACKRKTLTPYYQYMQSSRGHTCMRSAGPIIAFMFYATQIVHAISLATEVGPAFMELYGDSTMAKLWLALGWLLFVKVTYTYYWVNTSDPCTPRNLKAPETALNPALPKNTRLESSYGPDIAELLRYSPVWHHDRENLEQILLDDNQYCNKCRFAKPLRTHHCSVCNKCVLLMDHHCMWTNNCIGLGSYKQFLQLNLYGQLACWYTVFMVSLAGKEDSGFLYFAKCWDMLVAKMLLALTGFNFYVMSTGLTYLEFKTMMEARARELNRRFYGRIEETGNPE